MERKILCVGRIPSATGLLVIGAALPLSVAEGAAADTPSLGSAGAAPPRRRVRAAAHPLGGTDGAENPLRRTNSLGGGFGRGDAPHCYRLKYPGISESVFALSANFSLVYLTPERIHCNIFTKGFGGLFSAPLKSVRGKFYGRVHSFRVRR